MKKNSLKFYFWVYFSLFAIIILFLLWIFQILFLNRYYEFIKNKSMGYIAKQIKEVYNKNDYQTTLDMISYKKDICIEIFTDRAIYYSSDSVSRGCIINDSQIAGFAKYHNYFVNSNKDIVSYELMNSRYNTKILVYGIKLENNKYAFISTSLVPIASTFKVWRDLFIYISIIVLLLSFLIAYIVSRRISNPISKLNKTSKQMINGNYDIIFETGDSIGEINELAATLNNLKEELSNTETLRRELMANVSHDLRTPLTLIKANAEMAKDLNYNKKKNRDMNLQVIADEVDRLNLLVEDILDLSKAQSNTMILNKEKVNINDLIITVIERFNVLSEQNNYKFNYQYNKDCFGYADYKRIEQVLYNLISNATNYCGEDKEINIEVEEFKDNILIEISNTGDTISNDDLKHIWDKYYKMDKSYHRVSLGTGLGLSIVKNILELHNFDYGVKSAKNKTTFYFTVDKYRGENHSLKKVTK